MDDTDIKNVETWIRTKTLLKLTEDLNNSIEGECEALVDDEKLVEYFGEAYANDPKNFDFCPAISNSSNS